MRLRVEVKVVFFVCLFVAKAECCLSGNMTSGAFELRDFVDNPTLGQLNACRKKDLCAIAEHYGISISASWVKKDLKTAIISGLVGLGAIIVSLPEDSLSGTPEGSGLDVVDLSGVTPARGAASVWPLAGTPGAVPVRIEEKPFTLPRFDLMSSGSHTGKQLDAHTRVRLARHELERQEREREFQFRRELELRKPEADTAIRMRQLELQSSVPKPRNSNDKPSPESPQSFDVSKHVKLVPLFRESEVDSYFGAFERIAMALQWPRDVWAILLQCKLVGMAQRACAALSIEDSLVYEKLKSAILRVYELVPEAYRQRFRGLRKTSSQTYTDLAREKGLFFDRWCLACKAEDLASVRELMLLEEFKNCLPERIVMYLNEQQVVSLQQAATLADEFMLTHKGAYQSNFAYSQKTSGPPVTNTGAATDPRRCYFCPKVGHVVLECESYKRSQQGSASMQPKGMGVVRTADIGQGSLNETPDECFKPFIFSGMVSLTGKAEDRRPVTVLRDTGGSQSFILSHVLPLNAASACGKNTESEALGWVFSPPLSTTFM